MSKNYTVSIVIPAYNEADTIHQCLTSIQAQSVMPLEVIVVDNNSSDATVSLAAQFPFVRVIRESRQGVVHARNTGFNAARGAIIGRIDADTILSSTWVETVQQLFSREDIAAVTGSVRYRAVPFARFFSEVDRLTRRYLAWALGSEVALQGANLAIRRGAWCAVQDQLCCRGGMHEDFDLAIHLRAAGFSNAYEPQLVASVALRRLAGRGSDFAAYVLLSAGTYAQHHRVRRIVMYPVIGLVLLAYPLLRMLYMGYDERVDAFSFRTFLRSQRSARVNPALFVE